MTIKQAQNGKPKKYLLNLSPDLAARLIAFCEARNRKLAAVITEAVEKFLADNAQVY